MKRHILSVVLFVATFITTYIFLCYGIPGWRIKLEAAPVVYFLESLKYLILIKGLCSLIVGLIIACIPGLVRKLFRK